MDSREPDLEVYDDEAIEQQLLKSTQAIKAEIAELEGNNEDESVTHYRMTYVDCLLCVCV